MASERVARLAHRVIERYGLTYPLNVMAFARQIASVRVVEIPDGMDGLICYRMPPKPPYIVLKKQYIPRLNFTLAHELGHHFIPWHPRTSYTCDVAQPSSIGRARRREAEADIFAGELLAPKFWLRELFQNSSLADAFETLTSNDYLSIEAACMNLRKLDMPLCIVREDTIAKRVYRYVSQSFHWLNLAEEDIQHKAKSVQRCSPGKHRLAFYTYDLPRGALPAPCGMSAKAILTEIVSEYPDVSFNMLWSSAQGTISALNGNMPGQSIEVLYRRCIERLRDKPNLEPLTTHPQFELFVAERCRELHCNQ